jgi:hypothetical protein
MPRLLYWPFVIDQAQGTWKLCNSNHKLSDSCKSLLNRHRLNEIASFEFDNESKQVTHLTIIGGSRSAASTLVSLKWPDHIKLPIHMTSGKPHEAFAYLVISEVAGKFRMTSVCSDSQQWPSCQPIIHDMSYEFAHLSKRGSAVYTGWTTSNLCMTIWPFETKFNHLPPNVTVFDTFEHYTVAVDLQTQTTLVYEYHLVKYHIPQTVITKAHIVLNSSRSIVYMACGSALIMLKLENGEISVIARLASPIIEIDHHTMLCSDGSLWEYEEPHITMVGKIPMAPPPAPRSIAE